MALVDVHQHLWTEPLLAALERRSELPYVRVEQGLAVLHLAGERPYVIDVETETSQRAAALVEQDGLDRALVCLSSPIGIEALPRSEALPLLEAYHEGALALGGPFGVWGAVCIDACDAGDVDRALGRGCVGISLPAGALASLGALAGVAPILSRLEERGAPLLIHPGPGRWSQVEAFEAPIWWPALTSYVWQMSAAWLAFLAAARARHPRLRVVFAMLAGLAPLQAERLAARGGPAGRLSDPLIFYETSSYGPRSVAAMSRLVGAGQLLYGSDRPVVEPAPAELFAGGLEREALADTVGRVFPAGLHRSQAVAL